MHDLKKKVCVVTGAAKSIGFGVAQRYCELGAKVALLDVNPAVLDSAQQLRQAGYTAEGWVVDITDKASVDETFSQIRQKFGPVYALVNVAGVAPKVRRDILEMTEESYDYVMGINTKGTLFLTQAVANQMIKQGKGGAIVNISSCSAYTSSTSRGEYCISKAGVSMITKLFADRLAPEGITVNEICPGITDATGVWDNVSAGYIHNLKMPREQVVEKFTAKIPLKRLTSIDDVVDFVEFLTASGDYCTGQAFNISGGREMH